MTLVGHDLLWLIGVGAVSLTHDLDPTSDGKLEGQVRLAREWHQLLWWRKWYERPDWESYRQAPVTSFFRIGQRVFPYVNPHFSSVVGFVKLGSIHKCMVWKEWETIRRIVEEHSFLPKMGSDDDTA